MQNLKEVQELAELADFMVIEPNNIVRLIWDEGQGKGENKRLNERIRKLKKLIKFSQRVVKDDGNLHVELPMGILDMEQVKFFVEEL